MAIRWLVTTIHRLRGPPSLLLLLPRALAAQGVTTAAIQGTVSSEGGQLIPGAAVHITNASNGRRWEVATSSGDVTSRTLH